VERNIAISPVCAPLPLSTHRNQSRGRTISREQDWADFGERFSPSRVARTMARKVFIRKKSHRQAMAAGYISIERES
jgi:hypothetical protein